MDKTTKQVLKLLQEDARYTAEMIAVMINSTHEAVKSIITSLEDDGIIVKYTAIVDNEKANSDYVDALIEVTVTPQKRCGFDAIADEICKSEMVKNVYLMSGSYDIAITIEGKTVRDISLFVSENLATIDSVVSTTTHFILKQYMVSGVVLKPNNVEKRELIR